MSFLNDHSFLYMMHPPAMHRINTEWNVSNAPLSLSNLEDSQDSRLKGGVITSQKQNGKNLNDH